MAILLGHAWVFSEVFATGTANFADTFANRVIVRMDGLIAVFFALSAFLLYRPMIAHRAGGPGAPRVADYGLRRFLRLYPAYWLALSSLAIFPGLFGAFSGNWWAFYTLTDFLDLSLRDVCPTTFGGVDQFFRCGLPQTWSLGVEMTFYVALPFYAAATALIARGRPVRTWLKAELALLVVLAAASLFLGEGPPSLHDEAWFKFSLLGHFYWLALGLGMAVVSVVHKDAGLPAGLRGLASHPNWCWAGAFATYCLTVLGYYPLPFPVADYAPIEYLSLNLLQGAGAVLLLVPVLLGNPNLGVPSRVFGHPVLMWLGVISYGIVLWHVTVAVNLGFAGADAGFVPVLIGTVLLTIPLAALSYYVVERPLMKLKYRPLGELLRGRRRGPGHPAEGAGRPT